MSLILVVEPDTTYAERIAAILLPDGWDVVLTDSRESALRSVATQAPSLLIASGSLPGAKDLLQSFARHAGGPGSVVLVPATLAGHISASDFAADDVLTKPIQEEDLRQQIHNFMETPAHPRQSREEDNQLTSADIFGDLLAEVEAEAAQRPGANALDRDFEREIDRKLAETFSGVLGTAARSLPTTAAGAAAQAKSVKPFSLADNDPQELDALLERTLSSLRVETAGRDSAAPAATPEPLATPEKVIESRESPDSAPSEIAQAELSGLDADEAPAAPASPVTNWVTENDEGQRFGEYRLLQKIATGGMAEVWKARRSGVEGFEKTVAIKKILSHLTGSPDFVSMFVDEAKLAAQLSHNHIIQIYDLGKVEDDYFIAMEYVEGKDLRSLLARASSTGQRIPPALAVLIASRLAQALDHAHRQRDFEDRPLGLVHRDVSPQNVLISWQGDIKLCDFGIVKAVVKASTTQIGALKGKLQYMSPEQAMGLSVDPRSDLFSLGSVLFEMLTGQKLFSAETEMAVLEAVQECRHKAPRELVPDLPVEIEQVVLRALAKDPDKRHDSAGELAIELAATVSSMPGQTELARYVRSLYLDEPGLPEIGEFEPPEAPEPAAVVAGPREWEAIDSEVVFEPAPELPMSTEEAPATAPEVAPFEHPEPAPRKRLAVGWWIAALLVIAAAVVVFWWWTNQPPRLDPGATTTPATTEPPPTNTDTAPAAPEPAATPRGVPLAAGAETGAADLPGIAADGDSAGSGASLADPADLEQRVDEVLQRRAAELQRSFEEERQRLERELEAARLGASVPAEDSATEPPPDGDGSG